MFHGGQYNKNEGGCDKILTKPRAESGAKTILDKFLVHAGRICTIFANKWNKITIIINYINKHQLAIEFSIKILNITCNGMSYLIIKR